MHINTAVVKHIIPILEKYEAVNSNTINFFMLSEEIKRQTNKGVNFRRVTKSAVELAHFDFKTVRFVKLNSTFSFNIDYTSEFREEMEMSTEARRNRFRHLFVKNDWPRERIGIKLEASRSDICFTINYVLEPETNRIYFVAVIGFYGTSINSWADRVGLHETINKHSVPSTHYMSISGASEYVFLLERVVKLKLVK